MGDIPINRLPEEKRYRPSNGTEGEYFMEDFCYNCIHEKWTHTQNDADKKCDILSRTLIYDTEDPEYPEEWQYDDAGNPTCTSHKHWDWGNDRDGVNEPPPEPVDDPNQLVMPFIVDEICKNQPVEST